MSAPSPPDVSRPLRSFAIHALVFERQDGFSEIENHRKYVLIVQ